MKIENIDEPKIRCIVRLRTSIFERNGGVCIQRDIYTLRRKSLGFDFFSEEVSMAGADLCANIIQNLNECKDGIYEVLITDERKDWETGCVEEYKFSLVPFCDKNLAPEQRQ